MASAQRAGILSEERPALSADRTGLGHRDGGDPGQKERLAYHEGAVGHERTGQASYHGIAGNGSRHTAAAGQSAPGQPAPATGRQPDSGTATTIRAGVARFEQYVSDFAALVDKVGEYFGRQIARQQEQKQQQPQHSYFRMRY